MPKRLLVPAMIAFAASTPAFAGYTLTTLAQVSGISASALTVDADGNLYGTARGGSSGDGFVYEVVAGASAITTLVSFNGTNGNNSSGMLGGFPSELTIDQAGNLFGTTAFGGQYNQGSVFEIQKSNGLFSTIATFNGVFSTGNGDDPVGKLAIDPNGNLFGATSYGGFGTNLFEVVSGSHSISLLGPWYGLSIPGSYSSSYLASGPVMDSTRNLYAVANNGGSLIELSKGATNPTLLANVGEIFGNTITRDAAGDIFGATYDGSIYELPSGGSLKTLASLNPTGGSTWSTDAGVYRDAAGNLFGTAFTFSNNPVSSAGEVYEVPVGTNTAVTIATFPGDEIAADVTGDANGTLYGITDSGKIFELSTSSVPEPACVFLLPLIAFLRRTRKRI